MPSYRLNSWALHAALDRKREDLGWSWRGVAEELKLNPSTFSRMSIGKHPDVDALVTMLAWLDAGYGDFTEPPPRAPKPDVDQLLRMLRRLQDVRMRTLIKAAYQQMGRQGRSAGK